MTEATTITLTRPEPGARISWKCPCGHSNPCWRTGVGEYRGNSVCGACGKVLAPTGYGIAVMSAEQTDAAQS